MCSTTMTSRRLPIYRGDISDPNLLTSWRG